MPEQLSQDLSQKPENGGMSAEMVAFRLKALDDLIMFKNFENYAEDILLLSKRALEAGNVSLADRLGTEVFTAMGNHTLAKIEKALGGSKDLGSVQTSLDSIAKSQGFGK